MSTDLHPAHRITCDTASLQVDTETDKAAKEARKQHCPFNQMEHLDFSFQKLWHIQNLNGLDGLVKLQLDNNRIEKIENLSHLVGAAAGPQHR